MMRVWFPQEVCEILIYEIEAEPGADSADYPMGRLIAAINARINPGRRTAQAIDIGNGRPC